MAKKVVTPKATLPPDFDQIFRFKHFVDPIPPWVKVLDKVHFDKFMELDQKFRAKELDLRNELIKELKNFQTGIR